ncbi:CHAT domain-containing tetratricopeptide repeat protein [Nitrosomonas marina]|uniref:CHAT domain-containing protein n=1 Tax=Nitrosomonas marina TaxID=917 RepID=A0A1H8BCX8_9PROT|nr:CHAT domain-containing protein [Nitrosomonas marina]SEM80672.1 CHAT domain-containing protein [Nitrosomonas marina]
MKARLLLLLLLFFLLLNPGVPLPTYAQNNAPESLLNQVITLIQQGEYEKAAISTRKLIRIAESTPDLDPEYRTLGYIFLGRIFFEQAQYAQAEKQFTRALQLIKKLHGDTHQDVAWVNNELAALYRKQGQFLKAESLYAQSLKILKKTLGAKHPDVAIVLNELASVYQELGQNSDAESLFHQSLTIRENAFGPEHPDVALALNNLAVFYRNQSQFAKAIPLFERSTNILEQALGPDHLEVALSLNNLALLYQDLAQSNKAGPLFERALSIRKKVLGPDHPEVAASLNNLADHYHDQRQYKKAAALYKESLEIFEQTLGPTDPNVTLILNNLASLYRDQLQFGKAKTLFEQSLRMREQTFGPEHPEVALILNNLGDLYHAQGLYKEAEPLYERSLGIYEKTSGADQTDIATGLNNLAALYRDQGLYAKAQPLYQRSLEIFKKAYGNDHPHVATGLNNLALLYYHQGRYTKAKRLLKRSLTIWKTAYGTDHPDVALTLSNLALLYQAQGQHIKAEPLLEQALAIRKKLLGANHTDVAMSMNNLAEHYRILGQYASAEPLYLQSLKIWETALGQNHPDVAKSLNNLALLYWDQRQYAKAEPLYKRSLEIREKMLGPDHPDVAASLNSLAMLYRNQGQLDRAEPLLRQALEIYQNKLGANHPFVAKTLNNLALLHWDQGRYASARPLFEQLMQTGDKTLGSDHPEVGIFSQNFALNLWAQGEPDSIRQALALQQRANEISARHLHLMMTHGTEQKKHDFLATIQTELDAAISFHLDSTTATVRQHAARLATTVVLQRKGRILDSMNTSMSIFRKRMDPKDRALLDRLSEFNQQRSRLYNLAYQNTISGKDYFSRKKRLEREASRLEDQISKKSAAFLAQIQPVTMDAVQQAIPKDAVLIEYVRYQPFNPRASIKKQWGDARYAAYILKSQDDPETVDLGDAKTIEKLISDFRDNLNDSRKDTVYHTARKLDALIMEPLRKFTGNIKNVLVSPDGALNLIPFAALMDGNDQFLIKQHHFTYLSSGRDLLRVGAQTGNNTANRQPPAIFADVDFGVVPQQKNDVLVAFNDTDPDESGNRRSIDFNRMFFQSLPGTQAEAAALQKKLRNAKLFTRQAATEAALKQLDSPQILHLATHGFFLNDLVETAPASSNAARALPISGFYPSDLSTVANSQKRLLKENPLLRSGIALAGANQLKSGNEDGIVTALEVTGMDLWDTQLVVLSACETGVGDIQNSKGVFGLRRALVLAGSETQVMSLWKIDDRATVDLMAGYYDRLINDREGRSEAMRNTQLEILDGRDHNHPFYWAGFIVSGNWKPL